MPRIIALDVGQKRVGIAISDPLGLTAQPLTVLARKPHGLFLNSIQELVQKYEASLVLLGLPRRTDGHNGPEAQRILALAHEFKTRLNLEVATWEEWFTTQAAERVLKEGGLNAQDRQQVVDKTAATIILDGYLNFLASQRGDNNP